MKTMLFKTLGSFALSSVVLVSAAHAQVIKNEQTLLGGELTRAGNTNLSQLTDSELMSLCEQGYTSAFFLYSGAQARTLHCAQGTISYRSQTIRDVTPILEDVYRGIRDGAGRTFVHCNNGAHASGLVAAFALMQFCGDSPTEAYDYWSSHLGGYALQASNMAAIRRRINTFQVIPALELTAEERARVCNVR